MLSFILRKIFSSFITVFGVLTLVFIILRVVPGDPAETILGEYATEDDKNALRESLNLNKPLLTQYFIYLGDVLNGSLGYSLMEGERKIPVKNIIFQNLFPTIELAIAGMIVACIIAFPLGIISAIRKGKFVDNLSMFIALSGIAIPNFFLGPLLIYIFSIKLKIFPDPVSPQTFISIILPAFVLGTALSGKLARMLRAGILDVSSSTFVLQLKSKGIKKKRLIFLHILRNAMLPVITIMGLQFASLLTGTIITERVFSRPGIGTLLLDAISMRNYALVQGCVIFISVIYVFINFFVDVLYTIIDPRIKFLKEKTQFF